MGRAALAHLQLGHTGASSKELHCVQVCWLQVVALHDALQGRGGALKEVACMAARGGQGVRPGVMRRGLGAADDAHIMLHVVPYPDVYTSTYGSRPGGPAALTVHEFAPAFASHSDHPSSPRTSSGSGKHTSSSSSRRQAPTCHLLKRLPLDGRPKVMPIMQLLH
jgi:hypothetical protein